MGVVVVDTLEAALAACERLRAVKLLALDVEWEEADHTQVSLVQVARASDEIYVFDALALGQRLFEASLLLPLLSDPSIIKLCFDCRGDASVLFQRHGVRTLHALYDLQIVYAALFAHDDGYLRGLHRALEHALAPEEARAFAQRKATQKRRF